MVMKNGNSSGYVDSAELDEKSLATMLSGEKGGEA